MLFSSAVHFFFFAPPSFIPFLQFYKCQFIKRSNLNVGLISSIDLVMDLPSHFKPVCQRCLKTGVSEPFTGCRIQMWNYTLQVRCVMSTWQHIYCYGDQVWILVFTYSTLAAQKCLKIVENMKGPLF